ncbi:MAG: hypothetical protein ACJ75K_26170 [Actinomycetes bacterium]
MPGLLQTPAYDRAVYEAMQAPGRHGDGAGGPGRPRAARRRDAAGCLLTWRHPVKRECARRC